MSKSGKWLSTVMSVVTVLSLSLSPHPVIMVLCYGIHEMGHLVLARAVGAQMRGFYIGSFHLSITYDAGNLTYKRELAVQAGGIIFNFCSALLAFLLPLEGEAVSFFIICSISLGAMNLYPVSILDGGGMLKSLFLCIMSGDVAEKASKYVSFFAAILMWMVAVYAQIVFVASPSLFAISVLLLIKLCFSYC